MIDRRTLIGAATASAAGLALGGPARAAAGDVVLSESAGRFYATVRLNGEGPFRFVLDTGATTHFIARPVAERLRLPWTGDGNVRAYGGRTQQGLTRLQSFEVGGVVARDVEAVVFEPEMFGGQDGLIGYPILGSRAHLDLAARRLTLGAGPPPGAFPVAASVGADEVVLIGGPEGERARFVFDTGSPGCVLSPQYAARLASSPQWTSWPKLMRRDAQGRMAIFGFRPPMLQFGALALPDPAVSLPDPDVSDEIFHGADALFGANLIRRCAWTIDRRARTVHAVLAPRVTTP